MIGKCRMQNDECRIGGNAQRSRLRRRALLGFAFCILHSAFCICFTGCNVVGAIAAKVGPEPTIPAQFTPAQTPAVVLVENFSNPASLRLEADGIARHLTEELTLHNAAPMVEQGAVDALRQKSSTAYRQMPLDAIGRAVGAKQIIYVDLERFDMTQAIASEMIGGQAEARVRVVDDTGAILWPIDSAGGYPVSVKLTAQPVAANTGDTLVRRQLHAALADKIAKLFYPWKGDGSDGAEEQFQH
jgi:hypothetical protein